MSNTKRIKLEEATPQQKTVLDKQLEHTVTQLRQRLDQYERVNGTPYHIQLKEGSDYDYINPAHYVADDGRQTWERMVDKWGLEVTALWCEMTAFKYIDTRIGNKPNEDTEREMKKVAWYENKAKELFKLSEEEYVDGLSGTMVGTEEDQKEEEEKKKKGWFN